MENLTQSPVMEKKTFEPLPEDDYKARAVEFNIKPSKAGTSTLGSAQFEIMGGEFGAGKVDGKEKKGRRVFHNFILEHDNAQVVEWSNNKLNKLLSAVGASSIKELGFDYGQIPELVESIPVIISVGIEASYKKGDSYMKLKKAEREEFDEMSDDELAASGITRVFNNRIKTFKSR